MTALGVRFYISIAVRRSIVAQPNFRSLHEKPIPRGGGAVFSIVFLAGFVVIWQLGYVDTRTGVALSVGGLAATVVGFIDDLKEIAARKKLVLQILLAIWILTCNEWRPIVDLPFLIPEVDIAVSCFALVWLLNFYNFMDGIDGMAASGAVFLSVGATLLSLLSGNLNLVPIFLLLAGSVSGFLIFNWSPARIFMGDAGSLFLGYFFGVMATRTSGILDIGPWPWLILFAYFAGDTSTTTFLRMFLVKRWYGAHRSNAYQNLARVGGSHRRVVSGVMLYQLIWLLPLAVIAYMFPAGAPIAALVAYLPVIGVTYRYGPRYSSS